jgi:Cytochrome b5-like Heme/Steroid binding domain
MDNRLSISWSCSRVRRVRVQLQLRGMEGTIGEESLALSHIHCCQNMEQKSWLAIAGLLGVLIVGAAVFVTRSDDPVSQLSNKQIESVPVEVVVVPTSSPSIVVVPAPTTPSFTLSQVSAHATAADCWTVVHGNVYNVTPFVSRHPGGVEAISQVCGRDGTAFFQAQHGGQKPPESMLSSLKVGVLAK